MTIFPVTKEDQKVANEIRAYLTGIEYHNIEKILSKENVDSKILSRIAEYYKTLTDMVVEHMSDSEIVKEFLKKLSHSLIERNKDFAKDRLQGILD